MKKRTLDIYTQGDMEREEYVERSRTIDDEMKELEKNNIDISNKIPLLQKKDVVNNQLAKFCVEARVKFEHSELFENRRSFVLEYASKIIYHKEDLAFYGSVPIKDERNNIISKLDFCIKTKIPYKERFSRKRK